MCEEYAVQMEGITKRFGTVLANNAVDIQICRGEIHAIIGENGAGKTTIMEILYGFYQADEGQIKLFGKPVTIKSPHDAIFHQIGMVHQHFMLIPPLTVTENIMLGIESTDGLGRLSLKQTIAEVKRLADEYSLYVDPLAEIADLSVGQQQRVEILKALYRGAEILILDEPTAVLTPLEVKEFFKILIRLKKQGKTVIIITHKLDEVMAVSDQVTVMRSGNRVGQLATKETTSEELSTMMVGRQVLQIEKEQCSAGKVVLEVKQATVQDGHKNRLDQLSLQIHAGEILGIAGLEGNGQTELIAALTGLIPLTSGKVLYKGKDITNQNAKDIRHCRIGHIPADRKAHGYIATYTNAENLILGFHDQEKFCHQTGFFRFSVIHDYATKLVKQFDLRPALIHLMTGKLSGGNQQKLIIAREFAQNPDLLIIAQPTRGVDIGAIEFIHQKIIELRDQGKAILLVSAELEEIRTLSDRAFVMYEGKISGKIDLQRFNEQEVGLLMTGQTISPNDPL